METSLHPRCMRQPTCVERKRPLTPTMAAPNNGFTDELMNLTLQTPKLDNYIVGSPIGKGAYSVVFAGKDLRSGEKVALKVLNLDLISEDVNPKRHERVLNEVAVLQKVHHPNIVPLREVVQTESQFVLVMELVEGGELFDKIVEKGSYDENAARKCIYKIVHAIHYLHSLNIVHRDLKPENLLLRAHDYTDVVISDFGLSRLLPSASVLMSTACGTLYCVAPEVLKPNPSQKGYNKQVDLWSIGVICYFLLAGYPPFYGKNLPDIAELVISCQFAFHSPYWDKISPQAKDFVQQLLVLDPAERMTANDALEHPWLAEINK